MLQANGKLQPGLPGLGNQVVSSSRYSAVRTRRLLALPRNVNEVCTDIKHAYVFNKKFLLYFQIEISIFISTKYRACQFALQDLN